MVAIRQKPKIYSQKKKRRDTCICGLPQWLSGKESACNVGDAGVWSLCWEDPLEEGTATQSSILAWRIPMDRGTWQAMIHRVTSSGTWLSDLACTHYHMQHSQYWSLELCFSCAPPSIHSTPASWFPCGSANRSGTSSPQGLCTCWLLFQNAQLSLCSAPALNTGFCSNVTLVLWVYWQHI